MKNQQIRSKIEIRKTVDFKDLHWSCVHERLSAKVASSGLTVELLIKQFKAHFFGGLKPDWVSQAILPQGNNLVAAALCECHGCDELTIERHTQLSLGAIAIPLFQGLRFKALPVISQARTLNTNVSEGMIRIGPDWFSVEIKSYRKLIVVMALTVLAVSLFYALAAILILRGLAVFTLFMNDPVGILSLATKRGEIGISLLSFVVGSAVFIRGSIRLIYRLISSKWQRSK